MFGVMTDTRCCDGDDELRHGDRPCHEEGPRLSRRLPDLADQREHRRVREAKLDRRRGKGQEPSAHQQITHALEVSRLITSFGIASPAVRDLLPTDPSSTLQRWVPRAVRHKKDAIFRKPLGHQTQACCRQCISGSIEALIAPGSA